MKAILFDLGRVLVGYDHAQTLASLASICANDAEDPAAIITLLHAIGDDLLAGRIDTPALHAFLHKHAGATADPAIFFAAFTAGISRDEQALAYAVELEQRPNVLVAVMSNTNETHVRWLDEHVPELRSFDLVMMSNELGMGKPDPAVFRLALDLLDVGAHQTLFVDDLQENVDAAAALGMMTILHTDWALTRPLIEEWLRAA